MNGNYEFEWEEYVKVKQLTRELGSDEELVFDHKKPRLSKCEQNFYPNKRTSKQTSEECEIQG